MGQSIDGLAGLGGVVEGCTQKQVLSTEQCTELKSTCCCEAWGQIESGLGEIIM